MQAQGKDLFFISRILRDGSGVELIEKQEDVQHLANELYDLSVLSILNSTYVASAFNSYVVKLLD